MASCRLPNSPDPLDARARGQLHLGGDLLLRFLDGAAKVAFTHREFDREIALLLFAVDVGRAGYQFDRRDLAERHLRDAVRTLRADPQILDGFRALAVLRRQANDDRKMAVAAGLIEIAGAVASDRSFDRGIDIARRKAVAGGASAVDIDLDRGLAERGENREIGDPLHRRQHGFDLVGGIGERLQVIAVQLDGVLALHAGHRFRDVVLQVLREIELDAGKLVLQLGEQLGCQFVLVFPVRPFLRRLERREEFRIEEARRIGAVVGPAVLRNDRLHFGPGWRSACASR